MIALNHVLTGTAIGMAVKNPLLVAPLAFLSHFVLDVIPHYAYPQHGKRLLIIWSLDAVASGLTLILLTVHAPELAWAILVGGVLAELPDVFWLHELFILKRESTFWYFKFHRTIQWSETPAGIIPECMYAALLIALNIFLVSGVK